MSILFYDHLVNRDEINLKLEKLELQEQEKSKFKTLIDEILHAGVMEFILQKLHPHDHATFLNQLERAPYDPELLSYLKKHIDEKIEESIEKESNRILNLVLKDIHHSSR